LWPDGWNVGATSAGGPMMKVGPATVHAQGAPPVVQLANDQAEVSHLYQTVKTDSPVGDRRFACGVWVRASTSVRVRLLLTDARNGLQSEYYSGNGNWQWLQVSYQADGTGDWVRMHISVTGPGTAEACGPILGEGDHVTPTATPPGASPVPPSPVPPSPSEKFNLADYRVNDPHVVLGLSGHELETNLPTVYGLRCFGGVDAMKGQRFMRFLASFEPTVRQKGGGLASAFTTPRLLDLTGCRYGRGVRVGQVRETALSRFMLFEGFEILPDDQAVLERLKSPSFDPLRTIVLEMHRAGPPASSKGKKATPSRRLPAAGPDRHL
ncbi:hypothetical protein LCGC14_2189590, partial [marine sediment metagenome]